MFSNVFARKYSDSIRVLNSNKTINAIVTNRNPRNLEKLRVARKPVGYYYDNINVEFWHKLKLDEMNRYVSASIVHNTDKVAVTASTKEWAIRKHLYSATDTAAYVNLARVFAERCLETGITSCFCDIQPVENSKVDQFLKTLESEGVTLREAEVYNPRHIWHKKPEKKPWLVHED